MLLPRCLGRLLAGALLLLLASAAPASAQLVPLAEGGARALAMGRATTALRADVWGHHNPASWATIELGTAGLFASQAFGLSELRLGALAAAYPTPYGTAAVTARTYGFEDFRETQVGLGFGRAIPLSATRFVHLGAHLQYTGVSITEFGSAGALGLSLGALTEVMPSLDVGFYIQNLNRPEISDLDPLRTALAVGLAYRPIEQATVVFAVDKDIDYAASYRGGLEVQPVEVLFLRAGFSTAPARFSTGVGVHIGPVRADVAADRHEVLGWTPAFELGVVW